MSFSSSNMWNRLFNMPWSAVQSRLDFRMTSFQYIPSCASVLPHLYVKLTIKLSLSVQNRTKVIIEQYILSQLNQMWPFDMHRELLWPSKSQHDQYILDQPWGHELLIDVCKSCIYSRSTYIQSGSCWGTKMRMQRSRLRDGFIIERGYRIRPIAFVTRRQHHNLLASAMMGLQAVNETTQAHGCWTANISMPPLTYLSVGVETEDEWLEYETCPQPVMSFFFLVTSPDSLSSHGKRSCFAQSQ